MAQNQRFSDPRYRAIASARSRGRAPAIAVAPLTRAWARRTKSTMAVYRVAHGKISGRVQDEQARRPRIRPCLARIIAAVSLNRNRKGAGRAAQPQLAAAACGRDVSV